MVSVNPRNSTSAFDVAIIRIWFRYYIEFEGNEFRNPVAIASSSIYGKNNEDNTLYFRSKTDHILAVCRIAICHCIVGFVEASNQVVEDVFTACAALHVHRGSALHTPPAEGMICLWS